MSLISEREWENPMKIRRIMVWASSITFGLVATAATIFAFGTTFDRFSASLFPGDLPLALAAGYGSLAFIWLDLFLRTEYLKR